MSRHRDVSDQDVESEAAAEAGEPLVVPHVELAADTLQSLIESFVLREGTEYGEREVSLEQKVAQVMRQLELGEAQIIFEPASESIDIVVAAAKSARNTRR